MTAKQRFLNFNDKLNKFSDRIHLGFFSFVAMIGYFVYLVASGQWLDWLK